MKLAPHLAGSALVLAGLLAAPWFIYGREPKDLDAAARAAAGGSAVKLSRGWTWYQASGPEAGPVVVLVAGLTLPSDNLAATAQMLAAAGCRVIRYDLYGRGVSDRPEADYDLPFFAAQLAELLDAVAPGRKASVVGTSFGAEIATEFVAEHPERVEKLVLIDPGGLPSAAPPWMVKASNPLYGEYYFRVRGRDLLEGGLRHYIFHPELASTLEPGLLRELQYKGFHRAIVSTLRYSPLAGIEDTLRKVGAQDRPVLVIWGKQDQVFPFSRANELLKLMPKAQLLPVDQAGHISYLDRPDVVHPALRAFLATPGLTASSAPR